MNVPNDLIGNPRRLNITTGSTVGEKQKPTASYAPKNKDVLIETCVNGIRVLEYIRSRKFEGIKRLKDRCKKKRKDVRKWLTFQDTYTLHKLFANRSLEDAF